MLDLLPMAGSRTRNVRSIACLRDVLITKAELSGDFRHRLGPNEVMQLKAAQSHRFFFRRPEDLHLRQIWHALFGPFRYPKANSLIGATQLSIMR